ncbi:MAG: hypothetical protein CNLJKLNK_00083 [Holosporales bacterium]
MYVSNVRDESFRALDALVIVTLFPLLPSSVEGAKENMRKGSSNAEGG